MQLFRMLPLTLALGAALAAPAQAQSLIELVESARAYDSSWQSAQAQLEAARRRADQARAGLLPSAGLSAGVSRSNTEITVPPVDRNTSAQNLALSASQPLYRPANRIAYEQGQRGVDVAQAQLDAAQQDLLVRVSQAYFDVLAAQDTLTFVQATPVKRRPGPTWSRPRKSRPKTICASRSWRWTNWWVSRAPSRWRWRSPCS